MPNHLLERENERYVNMITYHARWAQQDMRDNNIWLIDEMLVNHESDFQGNNRLI